MKLATFYLALLFGACAQDLRPSDSEFANLEPAGSSQTYFVSGNGNDDSSGLSAAQAFRTLQKAADLTQPGDLVLVMDGEYTHPGSGSIVLYIQRSGTPDHWIRYRAHPGHNPRIRVEQHWAGIMVGAAYVLVEGFTVEGDAPKISLAYALQEMSNLDNPITSGNCIYVRPHFNTGAIAHDVILRNNHVFNCPGAGIGSTEADYLRIEDNRVHHNGYYSPYANSGISVYLNRNTDSSTATKVVIRRNLSYQNENKVPNYYTNPDNPSQRVITDGNGIIVDDTRNRQNPLPSAPYLGHTLVENNLVFDNGGRGLLTYLSDNVTVRFNTAYQNARTPSMEGDLLVNDSARVEVYGNIVVARPDREAVRVFKPQQVRFSHNLYFGGLGQDLQDPSDQRADPKFVGPSTDPAFADFRLQSSSPAINRLLSPGPKHDLEKKPRPQGFASDLGAYER